MYSDSYSGSFDPSGMIAGLIGGGFLLVYVLIIFAMITFALVLLLLQTIALYKMAQKVNHPYAWLAWIPIANSYVMATIPSKPFDLISPTFLGGKCHVEDRNKFGIYYLIFLFAPSILSMVIGVLSVIPVIGYLIAFLSTLFYLAYFILTYIVMYQIYKDLYDVFEDTQNTTMMSILSIIFPIIIPFYMFILSKKVPLQ